MRAVVFSDLVPGVIAVGEASDSVFFELPRVWNTDVSPLAHRVPDAIG